MRIYGYVRAESENEVDVKEYYSIFYKNGFSLKKNRLIIEDVNANKPLFLRDRLLNLIEYSLEDNDLLVVKSIDCLGSSFVEISELCDKIFKKKIRLVCLDYSKNELTGDLKIFFLHFLKICCDFENKFSVSSSRSSKKVGRPEILSVDQKKQVLEMYKKGWTIYSLAKHFSVTRTVIQRIIRNSSSVDFN